MRYYKRHKRHKAYHHVNWIKLIQILKENGVNWRERKLNSKLYMNENVRARLDQGETRKVNTEKRIR